MRLIKLPHVVLFGSFRGTHRIRKLVSHAGMLGYQPFLYDPENFPRFCEKNLCGQAGEVATILLGVLPVWIIVALYIDLNKLCGKLGVVVENRCWRDFLDFGGTLKFLGQLKKLNKVHPVFIIRGLRHLARL